MNVIQRWFDISKTYRVANHSIDVTFVDAYRDLIGRRLGRLFYYSL